MQGVDRLPVFISLLIVALLFLPGEGLGAQVGSSHTRALPVGQVHLPSQGRPLSPSCTNCVIRTIAVGSAPGASVFDPGNGDVYVANGGSYNVSVIDGSLTQVVATVPAGSQPAAFAVSSDEVFVPSYEYDSVSVIDGATNKVVDNLTVGVHPGEAAYDPLNGRVYVGNQNLTESNLSVINATSNTVVGSIPIGGGTPISLIVDPANGYIYVGVEATNGTAGNVAVVSGATGSVLARLYVAGVPWGLAVDTSNGELYAVDQCPRTSCNTSVIAGTSLVSNVAVGPSPFLATYDPANGDVYVGDQSFKHSLSNVSVISGSSVVASVPVGNQPSSISFDGSNNDLYVENQYSNNVSVIDGTTNTVTNTIAVGTGPYGGVFDPETADVYVLNQQSSNVSVISTTALSSVTVTPPSATVATGNQESFSAVPSCTSSCPGGVSFSWSLTKNIGVLSTSVGQNVTFNAGSSSGVTTLFVNATLNGNTVQSPPVTVTIVPTPGCQPPIAPFSGTPPSGILSFVPIGIANCQSIPSPPQFEQELKVDSANYSGLEANNLSNVEFFNGQGQVIPSWLESGNSASVTNTIYWLRLAGGIGATSSVTIYMGFGNRSAVVMNNQSTGENPGLSSPYGKFDDGAHVFAMYQKWGGLTALPKGWSYVGGTPTVVFGSVSTSFAFPCSCAALNDTSYLVGQLGSDFAWETYGSLYNTGGNAVGFGPTDNSCAFSEGFSGTGKFALVCPRFENNWTDPGTAQLYGLYVNATSVQASVYLSYQPFTGWQGGPSTPQEVMQGFWGSGPVASSTPAIVDWTRMRPLPPDDIMPTTAFGIVSPVPLKANVTLSAYLVQNNTQVTASANVWNATSPRYAWALNGTTSLPCTGSMCVFSLAHPAKYHVNLTATDNGRVAWSQATLTVYNGSPLPLLLGSVSLSANDTHPGTSVWINASASGGQGTYAYSWHLNGSEYSWTQPDLPFTPRGAGNYTFTVNINDSSGQSIRRQTILDVVPNQTYLPLTLSVSLSANGTHPGTEIWVNTSVSGGNGVYTYSWAEGGATYPSTGSSISFVPGSAGNYTFAATVSDTVGQNTSEQVTLTVLANSTSQALTVTLSANSTQVYTGVADTITGSASGGHPAYSYVWSLNGTNDTSLGASTSLSVTFLHPGNYTYRLWVTDSGGRVANSSSLTVQAMVQTSPPSHLAPAAGLLNWWFPLAIAIIAVALLLLLFVWTRRRGQRESQGTEPEHTVTWVARPIPPKPPAGYMEGITVGPDEWDESAEPTTAYGTYTVSSREHSEFTETVRHPDWAPSGKGTAEPKTPSEINAYRPFSMKITSDGIQVEEIPKAAEGPKVVDAVFAPIPDTHPHSIPEPVGPSSEDVYAVLQSLARMPRSMDGIKQEVRLEDDTLFAVLGALSKARLVARGTRRGSVASIFVLTPLGRKVARRFIKGRQGEGEDHEAIETPEKAALPAERKTARYRAVRLDEGATLQDVRTVGAERGSLEEENPFRTLRPEDVNPRLKGQQPLSKEVLQPMEMRVQFDRGADARKTTELPDSERRAQLLMERAKKDRKKKDKFGVEQKKKPDGE